jgi:transcriptional regulator with XRE-family HTH domain
MGNFRPKPVRLAEKLKKIRLYLDLSQSEIVERLSYKASPLHASQISQYENDVREPPVQLILAYARLAKIPMEFLVDDELDLPGDFEQY